MLFTKSKNPNAQLPPRWEEKHGKTVSLPAYDPKLLHFLIANDT